MSQVTRRAVLGAGAAVALPAIGLRGAFAQGAALKISHQFPGGTATEGDFRDRLCRRFAAEVEKRTNGALKVVGLSGLVAHEGELAVLGAAQGRARHDLVPVSYAGGEVAGTEHRPDAGAGAQSYEQGAAWKNAEVGKLLTQGARRQGRRHGQLDLAGRRRGQPRASRWSTPDDAKGLKVRGGSREMDMMLKQAGASVITLPSNEIYAAMQTGAMDAAMTSSHQPHLLPARGGRQAPDHGARQDLLVHARAADDVEGGVRQAAQGSSRT